MEFKNWINETASVETIQFQDGFKLRILRNPTANEADTFRKRQPSKEIRGIRDGTGNVWIWDASRADHRSVAIQLGLDWYGDIINNGERFIASNPNTINIKWNRWATES